MKVPILKTYMGENQFGNYFKFLTVINSKLTILTIYENDVEWRRIIFTDGENCIHVREYNGPLITEGFSWEVLKVELNRLNIP